MHKLISLLSSSVVNKTVYNNRAALVCVKTGVKGLCALLWVLLFASRPVSPGAVRLTRCVSDEADYAAWDLMMQKRWAVGQTGPIDSDVAKVARTNGAATRSMGSVVFLFLFLHYTRKQWCGEKQSAQTCIIQAEAEVHWRGMSMNYNVNEGLYSECSAFPGIRCAAWW